MTKLTMALTGHRPQKLAGYDLQQPYYERMENQLIKLIKTALKRCDKLELHSGMALGADTVWARAIIRMRDQYPDRLHSLLIFQIGIKQVYGHLSHKVDGSI